MESVRLTKLGYKPPAPEAWLNEITRQARAAIAALHYKTSGAKHRSGQPLVVENDPRRKERELAATAHYRQPSPKT